jgi:hypothetical protein
MLTILTTIVVSEKGCLEAFGNRKAGAGVSLGLASITGRHGGVDNSVRVLLQNIAVNYYVDRRSRHLSLYHKRC